MSRRYALIEHSGDENKPDTEVSITKNFKKAKEWFHARINCARKSENGATFIRVVYELPVTFKPPNQDQLELIAMAATSIERPVNWRDMLAYICVRAGKNVDLSS